MAERKKYPYDEKAKERITRCLKKNYTQLKVNVRKEVKRKYKAYAEFKGVSLSEIIIRNLEEMIERDGFVYVDAETDNAESDDVESKSAESEESSDAET